MKATEERDDALAARLVTRQLDDGLVGFRSRVAEVNAMMIAAHGAELAETLGEARLHAVEKVRARHVHELAGLFANGRHHLRMTMPGGADGDAGRHVEELVAVGIVDPTAFAAFGDQRVVARIGRRDELVAPGNGALGVGPRQRKVNLRTPHVMFV